MKSDEITRDIKRLEKKYPHERTRPPEVQCQIKVLCDQFEDLYRWVSAECDQGEEDVQH